MWTDMGNVQAMEVACWGNTRGRMFNDALAALTTDQFHNDVTLVHRSYLTCRDNARMSPYLLQNSWFQRSKGHWHQKIRTPIKQFLAVKRTLMEIFGIFRFPIRITLFFVLQQQNNNSWNEFRQWIYHTVQPIGLLLLKWHEINQQLTLAPFTQPTRLPK